MKRINYTLLLCLALGACHHPEVEFLDFDSFKVYSTKSSFAFCEDGSLNPDIALMEDSSLDLPETKVATTQFATLARDMLGVVHSNDLIHLAGVFKGHDTDGETELEQSGKLIIPAHGEIKNLILVSHYTIGANFECPTETFPLEGLFAAKGYAVAIADYIGFGITSDRVHPYMHIESTARSVVDMGKAAKLYLEHIGRAPKDPEVILFGYSQGGSTTLAVMKMLQETLDFSIKRVYAGGGPYDLAATFDYSMETGITGIPCAIPMIVQGVNEGEKLGLDMKDFFKDRLLENYDEWINSKSYTVKQINQRIESSDLHDIMTDEGRDKYSRETARLYKALLKNSTLNFIPLSPIYLFHSREDQTVPFINGLNAEFAFKGRDVRVDFGNYGVHAMGCVRFILTAYKDMP